MRIRASAIFVARDARGTPRSAASVLNEPPDAPYEKMSTLFRFPDFAPGLGTLYVDPKNTAGRSVPRLRPQGALGRHHLHGAVERHGCGKEFR